MISTSTRIATSLYLNQTNSLMRDTGTDNNLNNRTSTTILTLIHNSTLTLGSNTTSKIAIFGVYLMKTIYNCSNFSR